jgi:hypothetical protein
VSGCIPARGRFVWGGSGHAPISRGCSLMHAELQLNLTVYHFRPGCLVVLVPMQRKPEGTHERKKFITQGGKVRETVYLFENEEEALEARAKKLHASKSEIMRRAIRAYLGLD